MPRADQNKDGGMRRVRRSQVDGANPPIDERSDSSGAHHRKPEPFLNTCLLCRDDDQISPKQVEKVRRDWPVLGNLIKTSSCR